ncbi:GGDEF domain-containing protein [Clostridium sp.]|uniref:GGDEF domain-containing protein n=1 Tax=Clostridium sp. TaxID=1506 RepID=UPI002A90D7A1|nr:GGDEF domain-containing protein [Clostridium sp.]MDY6012718.1 GGDEF domain-containing protein [Clostridium sp.]
MNLLNDIKERLSIFKDLYDTIILINPRNHTIIDIDSKTNSKKLKQTRYYRYIGFLNNKRNNKDCIIFQAYKTNKTSVKFELEYNKTFLTIATPITYDNKKYIVVLEKNISNTKVILDDPEYKKLENSCCNLHNILNKDVLTNIYNKRAINERLSKHLSKDSIPASIIMIDIDHFKRINDTYGHMIGDKVLVEFCNIISSCLKKDESFFGRFGGDEFMIILENVSLGTANKIANKIRKKVESHIFIYDNIALKLTCSLGGCVIDNANLEIKDFIEIADKNLYFAKNSGRNNILLLSDLDYMKKS